MANNSNPGIDEDELRRQQEEALKEAEKQAEKAKEEGEKAAAEAKAAGEKSAKEAEEAAKTAASSAVSSVPDNILDYAMKRAGVSVDPVQESAFEGMSYTPDMITSEPHAQNIPGSAVRIDPNTRKTVYDLGALNDKDTQWLNTNRSAIAQSPKLLKQYDAYTEERKAGQAKNQMGMSILGGLGLMDVNGADININTASPEMMVQGIQGIGDTEERKTATEAFLELTKTPGSRFYGYSIGKNELNSYRDSATMTQSEYNAAVKEYRGLFYAADGYEQQNRDAYAYAYNKIQTNKKYDAYTKRLMTNALDKAYKGITYQKETPEVPAPGEAPEMTEEEELGILERLFGFLGLSGDKKEEQTDEPAEAAVADPAAPQSSPAAPQSSPVAGPEVQNVQPESSPVDTQAAAQGLIDGAKRLSGGVVPPPPKKKDEPAPAEPEAAEAQNLPAKRNTGDAAAIFAERALANTDPIAIGPKEDKKASSNPAAAVAGFYETVGRRIGRVEPPTGQTEALPAQQAFASTKDAGDVVSLMYQGRSGQINPDDPNLAYFNKLCEDPKVRGLFGELDEELFKELETGNTPADFVTTRSYGSYGTTIFNTIKDIKSDSFPQELVGDGMMTLAEIVYNADQAVKHGDIAVPEGAVTYEVYLKAFPEEKQRIDKLYEGWTELIEDKNQLRANAQEQSEKALADARTAVLNGTYSDEQLLMVQENASADWNDVLDDELRAVMNFQMNRKYFEPKYGGFYQTSVYKNLAANGITDTGSYQSSIKGEMHALLDEDTETALSLGLTLEEYYDRIGGMSLDQLAQRANIRMQEQAGLLTDQEKEVLGNGDGVGTAEVVGFGVARGAVNLLGTYSDSLYKGLNEMTYVQNVSKMAGYYQNTFKTYGRDYYRYDLEQLIASGELTEQYASALQEAMDSAVDIYDVGIDPQAWGGLRSTAKWARDGVEAIDTYMAENATPGEYRWYGRVGAMTENVGMFAVSAATTAMTGNPSLGFFVGYDIPAYGPAYDKRLSEGYTMRSAGHMAAFDTAAMHLANSGTFTKMLGRFTGATTMERASWFDAWRGNPTGAMKAKAAVTTFALSAVQGVLDEAIVDEAKENIGGQIVDNVFGPVYRKIDAGEDITASDLIAASLNVVDVDLMKTADDVSAGFVEAAITSSLFALAGATGETLNSVKKAKAIVRGESTDVVGFVQAAKEDLSNPEARKLIDEDAKQQQIEERTVRNLIMDDGSDGKVGKAKKLQEQADSHQKEAEASKARIDNDWAAYQERKQAGDTDGAVAAFQDIPKAQQGLNEHTREAEQKREEAKAVRESKMQDARKQATLQIAQESDAQRVQLQTESDVHRYEMVTGDDTLRTVNLRGNMQSTGFANRREDFSAALDSWDGQEKGLEFVVGRVGKPLMEAGVQEAEIVLSSDKLAKIKKDHPAMGNEVIRQLPDVLEKPVVVMKSKTVPGRLTMFGDVKDDAGDPVLAAITIDPQKNLVAGANFIRLNSAYGKNSYPQEFINKSEILYVDKNRAADWAVSTGLQLPVDLTPVRDSSTSIVPQAGENDNPDIEAYRGIDGDTITPTPTAGRPRRNPVQTFKRLARSVGIGQAMATRKMLGMPEGVAGFYHRGRRYMATRANFGSSVEVTGHEIGHAIADRLGMTGTQQMISNLSARFAANYRPNELPGEAFAEFFWRYLISDEAARNFAGDAFVATLERRLRQENMYRPVKRAQREIRQYLCAEYDQKARLMIRDKSDKNRDLTLDERFAEAERKFISKMVDSTRPAEDVNDAVRAQTQDGTVDERHNLRHSALMQSTAPRRAWGCLTGNLTDVHGTIIGDSLRTRLARTGIRGEQFDALNEYMLAKHSIARDRQDKPVFDRQSITYQETRDYIREVERTQPEIVAAARAFQEFRHDFMMAYMVDTGYMTEETLDLFESLYPNYVPTYRVKDRGGHAPSGQTFQIRTATGSTEEIINPMDSFVDMVNTIVAMNLRNETAKTWDRVFRTYEGMGIFGREVDEDQRVTVMDMAVTQERVRQMLEDEGTDDDVIRQVLDAIGVQQVRRSGTGDVALPNIVTVHLADGSQRFYEMFDDELFTMLAGTQDSGESALNLLGWLTRTMSALTTGSNPVFALRNFMRDYQNSVNYGSWASTYATGVGRWLHSAWEVWRNSGDYQQYAALGGGGWTQIKPNERKGAEEYRGELFPGYNTSNLGRAGRWAGRRIWDTVTAARLNEIVEQASRFAEYKYGQHDRSTAEGRQEAYLAAQDVTTDFSRRGSSRVAAEVKAVVPFFNASLQGIYRTGRQVTEAEHDRAPTRFMKTVINTGITSALAAGLMLRHLSDDEKEEFLWLSDDLKAKHMYLPNFAPDVLGEAPMIRIPLSQDPLSYAVHAAVTNAMWSGEGEEWAIALSAVADNILNSLNPISSTTLDPIFSAMSNKNWYGSNIVPRSMDGWYVTNQYSETTPTAFIAASRLLDGVGVGVSPMMLQYVAEQYSGYIGQMAIPFFSRNEYTGNIEGASAVIEKVRKTLTSDPLISQEIVSCVYDANEFLTSVTKAANNDRPMDMLRSGLSKYEARAAADAAYEMTHSGGVIYEAKKFMTEGYKRIDEVEADTGLSDEEKYVMTSEIRREMIELALEANEEVEAFREKYITGESFIGRFMRGTMVE